MKSAMTDQASTTVLTLKPKSADLFDAALLLPALQGAFAKLSPAAQWRNPVMFMVYVGAILISGLWLQAMLAPSSSAADSPAWFIGANALWLWFTLLFANFAEALAEGRSKAQAASLRGLKKTGIAKKLQQPHYGASWLPVETDELRIGAVLLVEAGDTMPCDGEVIEGVASVDESAITGESAPVIRESGGDFSSVTGGTRVLSDWIVVRCTVNPGASFLDRMISMVEGAKRRKTPNEVALTILLVALTLVFLMATVTLLPFSIFAVDMAQSGSAVSITVLVALLVCLIPTTIGGLLSAIGVAGMSRMLGANVIATSGRAVEAAGDVDVSGHLDGLAALGDHVGLECSVHARDADGRQQPADGGGNQADQESCQRGDRDLRAHEAAQGGQGSDHEHEDQGQGTEKNAQGDLVGGLLAAGALHQRDHAVEKALARAAGDLHHDAV